MEIDNLIEIKDLHKSYDGKIEVIKGVSLIVKSGEIFAYLGKNGAGKSTLIDCMTGVKSFNNGKVIINGFDIKEQPIEAKSSFSYLNSEPTVYEDMSGLSYLEFIASVYKVSEDDFEKRLESLSKNLGLPYMDLNRVIKEYSLGMKQKLCIMASLIHNPKVWIMDEPTLGLDALTLIFFKKLMKDYVNQGNCIFIASHNIDLVSKLASRVAIINDGVIKCILNLEDDSNLRNTLEDKFFEVVGAKNA